MADYVMAFIKGLMLMASLIFAVGPQNAMLIRHGLRRDRPFTLASIFALCDILLIVLGVFGIGQVIGQVSWLRFLLVYGGSAFLLWFAGKAFLAAWRGGQRLGEVAAPASRTTLIATAVAVSLFNPGALVDTLVVIGSVSSTLSPLAAVAFSCGAALFSTGFFFTLAAFTGRFAPLLNTPTAWRVIDVFVGSVTVLIALHLLTHDFTPH